MSNIEQRPAFGLQSTPDISQIKDLSEWLYDKGCDISRNMVNIKVLSNRERDSDSIIVFGDMKIDNSKVALKIAFPSRIPLFSNSLDVEQQIYKNVTQKMIYNFHSPHLTSCIGIVKLCDTDSFEEMLSEEQRQIFNTNKNRIDKRKYDLTKANILVLSRCSGKTLFDYLENNKIDVRFKFNMLFQILYTLRCFERVGLSHNDLSLNNIFVDEITPQERYYYISRDEWVYTRIKFEIKIFDFDKSSIRHPNVDRNFTLDNENCEEFDQCNKYSSRRDLSAILLSFYKYAGSNDIIRTFIESLAVGGKDGPFLTRGITRPHIQLNSFRNDTYLKQDPEIDEKQLPSIEDCIEQLLSFRKENEDKLFNHFRGIKNDKHNNFGDNTIYTLSDPIIESYWNPSTTISRISIRIDRDLELEITDQQIDRIYLYISNKIIKPDNIFEKEFGKNYFEENTKKLFRLYTKGKYPSSKYLEDIMVSCYLLCLPFLYRFSRLDLENWLIKSPILYSPIGKLTQECRSYISFVDDIWNFFWSTLPISMISL
jgi:serine/threonine protein kinase